MRTLAAKLVISCAVLVLGAAGAASTATSASHGVDQTVAGVREHLVALQRIADRNGGTRAAGTRGYEASARYVAERMRHAGYAVRVQKLSFPYARDRSPPALRAVGVSDWSFRPNRDYATLSYSGAGAVQARVVAVDLLVPSPRANASTSGCEGSDFAVFPRGAVALVQRGTCTFRAKVANAVAAGASAVVVFNEGNAGRTGLFAATLGPPQATVPALAASFAVGEALRGGARDGLTGVEAGVSADVVVTTKRTRNVIAESRTGNASNLVVAGAHLDSVERGPGLNDNGSGSAALLEVAEQLARAKPRNRLRFAWWGAEELGLVGSRHYVGRLSAAARRAHALYVNLDMVGSPNGALFVYDARSSGNGPAAPPGSAAVQRAFARALTARRLPFGTTQLGGSSDHAAFAAVGVPVGGLFTGADGAKSQAEAETFGGHAGRPHDPCDHRACDNLANVDVSAVTRAAQATADVLRTFARNVAPVRRQQ